MSDANQRTSLQKFFTTEAIGGMLLMAAAVMAMILKNSAYGDNYSAFLETPVAVTIGIMDGALDIKKPLLLWINDGLMAIFFFMIGMEVKREILIGQFSDIKKTILPIIAGIGGIAVPAFFIIF